MSYRTYNDGARFGFGVVFAVGLAMAIVMVIGAMWIFGFGMFQRETADFRGETAQTEKVKADPNYRIASYDRFFDACAAVQSKEDSIKNLELELETTEPSDARKAQLQSSITAQRNIRAKLIRQYNADAGKTETRANFQASNLPYQLDIDDMETTCAA